MENEDDKYFTASEDEDAEHQHQQRLVEDGLENPTFKDIVDILARPDHQPTPQNVAGRENGVRSPDTPSQSDQQSNLLNGPPSDTVIFRHSHEDYLRCQVDFCKDIVSLWNTPHRDDAYIVLGVTQSDVPPLQSVGLRSSAMDIFWQSFFPSQIFQMKPRFRYQEVVHNSRRLGIFTIESSRESGPPCVVISDDMSPGLQKNQLWARIRGKNVAIPPSDFFVVEIHAWCLPEEFLRRSNSFTNSGSSLSPSSFSCTEVATPTSLPSINQLTQRDSPRKGADVLTALNNFEENHFVLVCGSVKTKGCKDIEALSYPPWIAVYDFDFRGRDSGLLNVLEESIGKVRHLSIGTWRSPIYGITERGSQWWSLRGRRDVPDSATPETSHWSWLEVVGEQLEKLCMELQRFSEDYTVLTFLVIWPSCEMEAKCVHEFLRKVKEHVKKVKLVVCYTGHEENHLQSKAATMLQWDFESDANLKIFKVGLDDLCAELRLNQAKKPPPKIFQYQLPSDVGQIVTISEEKAAELIVDLEVLYLVNPYTKKDQSTMKTVSDNFYRGGTIDWYAYYNMGKDSLDVERNIHKEFVECVRDRINRCKDGMITLYHNPGSGGSTLARRVLWELHWETPCVHVKQRTGSSTEDVAGKLRLVHDITGLPVLALMDGDDEPKIKQLRKHLQTSYIIILHVKRYPYSIKTPGRFSKTDDSFYLSDVLSGGESQRLIDKLIPRCDDDQHKIKALQDLHAELIKVEQETMKPYKTQEMDGGQATKKPLLFQYGMTVYAHEFRGLKAYVRGYLELDENPCQELKSWQKCLSYLALVYYYGQSALPLQFFAGVKGKPATHTMTMSEFPDQFKVFVVPDVNEGRDNYVRICHYLVATDILELILNRSFIKSNESLESLSPTAKRQLKLFCLEFIALGAKRNTKNALAAQTITHIMAKTFIFRDNTEAQIWDADKIEKPVSKQKFAQVIMDLDPNVPYTGRLEVMHKLCDTFPHDPNFRAHLGRCYSLCRPEEEEVAEEHFEEALKICRQRNGTMDVDRTEEKAKLTLLHIYHMYGMVFQRRLAQFAGWNRGGRPNFKTAELSLLEKLDDVFYNAERACENFIQARAYTQPEEEDCYTYMNEIHVRLQACDFVKRFYPGGNLAFLSQHSDVVQVRFVRHSITEVQDLIMECYNVVLLDNGEPLEEYISWFNSAFNDCTTQMASLAPGETHIDRLESLRLSITTKKLQFCRDDTLIVSVEADMKDTEIQSIVDDYEKIFRLVQYVSARDRDARGKLELDYKDWILAIRHPKLRKVYTVEEVLGIVQQWHDNLASFTSTFYLFVMHTLIGIGSAEHTGNPQCLTRAGELLTEKLQCLNQKKTRSKWPREWLGQDNLAGVRRLVSSSELKEMDIRYCRSVNSEHALEKLAVCKGTICSPNRRKLAGFIDLDLGKDMTPKGSVKVFFVPLKATQEDDKTNLHDAKHAGKRVEFHLAFTLTNGYEAYSVKLLKKFKCDQCPRMTEMTSLDKSVPCDGCGELVGRPRARETTGTSP